MSSSEVSPNVIGMGRPTFPPKINPNTCERCDGKGYTRKTSAVIKNKKTVSLGSGCPECRGRGVTVLLEVDSSLER